MPDAEPTATAVTSAAPVRIHTLGRFAIEVDGAPLATSVKGPRKPLALLKALIALGGQGVPAEQISESLWPDADGDNAQRSFTVALHRLRELIGRDAVLLAAGRVSLNPQRCGVDALELQARLETASALAQNGNSEAVRQAVEAMLALYRGPFLDGEFEPVEVLAARERLHGAFLRQVGLAIDAVATAGDPEQALALCRRALDADPVAEELVRRAMVLAAALGRPAEGLAAYERCRELLRTTLDSEPSAELRAEAEAARAATPEAERGPAASTLGARARRPWRRLALGAVLAVALLAAGGVAWQGYERWTTAQAVAELKRTTVHPLPDTPSIAVLAFENLTGDPELDYLSDGISDSIITALARLGDLLVIARSSSFTYKGRAVDVRQIGRELGVRHVLEGSLLRSGERLRITAQLIDAATGRHVWAGTYDQDLGNVLEPLDHISQQVLSEIGANLVWGEAMRFSVAATSNPRAYEKYALAHKYADLFEKDSRIRAKALFEEAIALDPSYARAMGWLGLMHLNDFQFGWSADPQWSLRIAEEWCHKALAIDANTAPALRALSRIYTYRRDYEQAIALGERAVAAEPGNGASQMHHAATLTMAGRAPEGVDFVLRALRAVPFPNSIMLIQAADTYYQQHEFSVARDFYEKILARTQRGVPASIARLRLIEIHMLEGREPEARALVAQELEASPGSTVSRRRNALLRWPYRDLSWVERHADALRRAGLPE